MRIPPYAVFRDGKRVCSKSVSGRFGRKVEHSQRKERVADIHERSDH